MSLTAPKDTLAYQRKGRPLSVARDLSDQMVLGAIKPLVAFSQNHGTSAKPETEALWFYLTNHAMKEIEFRYDADEPLPPDVLALVEDYHSRAAVSAARAFYYLLLITCRESRHSHKKSEISSKVKEQWGAQAMQGMMHYPDQNSIGAVVKVFTDYTPDATLRQITEAVRFSFYYPNSYSGGYGGKAWGKVSDCLVAYVAGEYSAEMMLDTVWTLCHNNGPIFNKGMLYGMYNAAAIREILDVQRSGQIPQLVGSNQSTNSTGFVTSDMKAYVNRVAAMFPDSDSFKPVSANPKVDWQAVMALGALGTYTHYQNNGASGSMKTTGGHKPKPHHGDGYGAPPVGSLSPTSSLTGHKGHDATMFAIAPHPMLKLKKKTRKEIANG